MRLVLFWFCLSTVLCWVGPGYVQAAHSSDEEEPVLEVGHSLTSHCVITLHHAEDILTVVTVCVYVLGPTGGSGEAEQPDSSTTDRRRTLAHSLSLEQQGCACTE